MYLKHLSLENFRNFTRLEVDVPRRAVLLVGANAQGKTSVLEAIYFLATFASFQTHADRQLVNFIEGRKPLAVGRIIGEYTRGAKGHKLEVRLILEPVGINGQRLRKEVLLDDVKRGMNDVVGHFNAVLFIPQMSQILEGGPDERRRYLNLTLAQTIPHYAATLGEYARALDQRNALLKMLGERGGDAGQLDVWDETLVHAGAQIIFWRIQAIRELELQATRAHHRLTRGKEVLRLAYDPAYDPLPRPNGQFALQIDTPVDRSALKVEEIERGFAERLKQLRTEEIARGVTTVGPQRDDMRFLANQIDLGDYGSRGQIRTALLSLKLAEVSWIKERTGQWPVILLDEVMAELDIQRRADLLAAVEETEQSVLTTTDLNLYTPEFVENSTRWEVKAGEIKVAGS